MAPDGFIFGDVQATVSTGQHVSDARFSTLDPTAVQGFEYPQDEQDDGDQENDLHGKVILGAEGL
jgi:hypothetical protein